MRETYLVSEYDLEAALYHLARLDGEEGWTRDELKAVIAESVDSMDGQGVFGVASGVYGMVQVMDSHQDNHFQILLLIRSIEGMCDDPKHMTVLSVGL